MAKAGEEKVHSVEFVGRRRDQFAVGGLRRVVLANA